MYDMKVSIRYIPHGKVLGLSKFARISEMVGKRLQLQEKIGSDIAEVIMLATGSKDVEVRIEAKHACVTARGAKNCNMVTRTLFSSGAFKTHLTSNVTESIS
jgi:GTP cyclohydrolase I